MRSVMSGFIISLLCLLGCQPPSSNLEGTSGLNPLASGTATCTVKDNGDGTITMTCPDGTSATTGKPTDGKDGVNGDAGPAGPGGTNGINGTSITAATESAGVNCPNGGLSAWSNATSPATLIQYVCNGEDGEAGTSITAATEAAGGYCVAGGISVWSTASSPSTLIQYVCSGENGSSCSVANNGVATFTMTCTNGTNVTWSSAGTGGTNAYIPDGILHGSYTISNTLDVAFLNGVTSVTGNLTISGAGLLSIDLPNLQIGGSLGVGIAPDLTHLSLPAVTKLNGSLQLYKTAITTISLPVTRVAGDVIFWENAALTSLSLSALATVGSTISISCNSSLDSFSIPVTAVAKSVEVGGCWKSDGMGGLIVLPAALTNFSLPALTHIGANLNIAYTSSLTSVSLPVTSLGGELSVELNPALTTLSLAVTSTNGGAYIGQNAMLSSISLPLGNVGDSFSIIDNDSLTSFSLPLTTVGGDFVIASNAALTSFSLPVTTIGGHLSISSNDSLISLGLPGLTNLEGEFGVSNNPLLCSTYATDLLAQLVNYTMLNNTSGNMGICPVGANWSFAADIEPIFVSKCQSCHTVFHSTAFKVSGDSATDYPVAVSLVTLASPSESLLLRKGTAAVAHAGGAVLSINGDPAYQAILDWIIDGANP